MGDIRAKKLTEEIASYQGAHTLCPPEIVRELVALIEPSYKCIGLQFIGGEGIVIRLQGGREDYCLKIMVPDFEKTVKREISLFDVFKAKIEDRNTRRERFLIGIAKQKELSESLELYPVQGFRIPKVIKIFDPKTTREASKTQYPTYFIMEWVAAENIFEHLKDKNHNYCLKMFLNFLKGIYYIQQCSIVHRDLKTTNLLPWGTKIQKGSGGIAYEMGVALLDWNVAKTQGDRGLSLDGTRIGTIPYAHPAISHDGMAKDYSFLHDIHACGLIFWEFCKRKKLPIIPDKYKKDKGRIEQFRLDIAKKLGDSSKEIFEKATSSDLKKRYLAIEDFIEDIEKELEKTLKNEEMYKFGQETIQDVYTAFLNKNDLVIDRLIRKEIIDFHKRISEFAIRKG